MTEKRNYFNAYGTDGPKPPCGKDCPDRSPGCAVTCQRWLDYVAERNANYKARRQRCDGAVATEAGRRAIERRHLAKSQRSKRGK